MHNRMAVAFAFNACPLIFSMIASPSTSSTS
jgi:hypothetical protein